MVFHLRKSWQSMAVTDFETTDRRLHATSAQVHFGPKGSFGISKLIDFYSARWLTAVSRDHTTFM
jgi:hypothetical protein